MRGHQVAYEDNVVECVDIEDSRRRGGRGLDVRLDARLFCNAGKRVISARMRTRSRRRKSSDAQFYQRVEIPTTFVF